MDKVIDQTPNSSSQLVIPDRVLVFPREIPVTPDAPLIPFLEEVEANLERLQGRPVFLAWAMDDPVFTPDFIDTYWKRS